MSHIELTILLPTYNESSIIFPLFKEVQRALESSDIHYEIIFIDDSNDDTPDIIHKLIHEAPDDNPSIRLIHRQRTERTGLATALIRGFNDAQGVYICCMDSDLQHPPAQVPTLFWKAKRSDSDIVVATRYREGGSAEGLEGPYRRFASYFCRFAAQAILPHTRSTSDPGSGFFLVKRAVVGDISFRNVYGFKLLIDLLVRIPGIKVSEVPYTFRKRENEGSKASLKQGALFFKHILSLRASLGKMVKT